MRRCEHRYCLSLENLARIFGFFLKHELRKRIVRRDRHQYRDFEPLSSGICCAVESVNRVAFSSKLLNFVPAKSAFMIVETGLQ